MTDKALSIYRIRALADCRRTCAFLIEYDAAPDRWEARHNTAGLGIVVQIEGKHIGDVDTAEAHLAEWLVKHHKRDGKAVLGIEHRVVSA